MVELFVHRSGQIGCYIGGMITGPLIAEIAALVGEPARAPMLSALLDGRALTASELAFAARITPQTASTHLAKLTEAGLLSAVRDGRHRYFRLASPKAVDMLDGIVAVALEARPRYRPLVAPQIFFQGVVVSIVSLVLYGRAVVILGASGGSALGALVPALSALLAVPLVGEWPNRTDWLGIMLCGASFLGPLRAAWSWLKQTT